MYQKDLEASLGGVSDKMTEDSNRSMKDGSEKAKELHQTATDTWNEMVNLTTSADKMEEIAKSGIKYNAAMLSHVTSITNWLIALVRSTKGGQDNYDKMMAEQIKANEDIVKGIANPPDPKSYDDLKRVLDTNSDLTKEQTEALKALMGAILSGDIGMKRSLSRSPEKQAKIEDAIRKSVLKSSFWESSAGGDISMGKASEAVKKATGESLTKEDLIYVLGKMGLKETFFGNIAASKEQKKSMNAYVEANQKMKDAATQFEAVAKGRTSGQMKATEDLNKAIAVISSEAKAKGIDVSGSALTNNIVVNGADEKIRTEVLTKLYSAIATAYNNMTNSPTTK
jgi:hypothetical protein